jgi:hypothetical protein
MPLNMSKIMTQIHNLADNSDATMPPRETMILSHDLSPWKAEQLYAVSKPIDGADNITLNGTYLTKVFEGPYKDAGKWHKTLAEYAISRGKVVKNTYFFYTNCPNCAKHYGKNYTIGLTSVS